MSIADFISKIWQRRNAILYYGCYIAIWTLFVMIVLQKGYVIFAYGIPREAREMNTVVFADSFAHGENLYAVSILEAQIPRPTSMYGFLAPLLMAPFIYLFSFTGLDSLQICELVTLAVEIAGALFFYMLLWRKTSHRLFSAIGMLLFYYCYWRSNGFGGAYPDQWGLTLSVILTNILYRDEDRGVWRPGLYAAMIIGLFYIKQYFVFTAFGLIVFLFIYSKKTFKRFIFYGIGEGITSILLVYWIFPLYLSEALPIGQGQTYTTDILYSLNQIKTLNQVYIGILFFGVIYIFKVLYKILKKEKWEKKISYELCQLICILLPTIYIAQNTGARYIYYLQLWYPYVVICCMVALSIVIKDVKACYSGKIRIFCYTMCGTAILFSFYQIFFGHPSFNCYLMTEEEKAAWERSYDTLEEYAEKGDILVPMLLSNYCLKNSMATSDYGQAEFNAGYNLSNYKESRLWQNLFFVHYAEAILEKNINYNNVIVKNAVSDQKYSCIALTSLSEYWLTEEEIIGAGYHILKTERLASGARYWDVTFYVKDDE